ncbi:malate dehydrogenase [Candidatus Bathyarchaeota archaeon]|nr:malate dehydrogenase [Candidatus Bathyarchaeota archaeon]MBS7613441.1 malate dehydrogenase [Candidatus Bathyarchaeota archaeon]MBS7617683.1 malate dehydrogenase [Candidatus Bathyarchaeota archaeon]
MVKAAIIGVGNLGSCIAFELAVKNLVDELILLDVVKPLAEGQAMDIAQSSASISDVEVKAGDYGDVADSDIVVITAGKPRTPSMKSRLELLSVNAPIVADIAGRLKSIGFEGLIVTVTNPVDIMNLLTWKIVEFDRFKVLGSSSLLDSARFRLIVSRRFNVKSNCVEGYVIGEHGSNQVPLFSKLKVMGKPVTLSAEEKNSISEELRGTALDVISKKGATVYAPASHTVALIESLLVSGSSLSLASLTLNGEYGVEGLSIGVPFKPRNLKVDGVVEWDLDGEEASLFHKGVEALKQAWNEVKSLIKV